MPGSFSLEQVAGFRRNGWQVRAGILSRMDIDKEALKRMIDERGIESLADLNGLLKEISKEVITSLYEGELRDHLGYDEHTQHAS